MAEDGNVVTTTEETPAAAPAEPFLTGSFAMYATESGDVILATNTNLMGDQVTRVPKFIVNQAKRSNPTLAQILDRKK